MSPQAVESAPQTGSALVVTGSLAVGLILCAASLWLNEPNTVWWSGVLANLGASALLFAPLYWATRTLDLKISAVKQRTEDLVHEVTDKLDQIQSDQGEQLARLVEELGQRDETRASEVSSLVNALLSDPSRVSFAELHRRALTEGWLRASPHARVRIASDVYVQVPASYAYSDPVFRVTTTAGNQLASVTWRPALSTTEFWAQLSAAVEASTSQTLDVPRFVRDYARLVERSSSHMNLKGAVCLFEPQWMLCRAGLVAVDRPSEMLSTNHLRDPAERASLLSRDWVDRGSLEAALIAVDAGMHA